MFDYNEKTASEKIFNLFKKISIKDITTADSLEIERYNRAETGFKEKILFWKLFKPRFRHITSESYIIPVKNGAVTGYLFRKHQKNNPLENSLIIYIHDGGWMLGNMSVCQAICSNICKAIGCAVLAIDYRLAPNFKFPTPLEDCYDAFIWAYNGARYWKIDPSRIFIMGICCGGNLAVSLTQLIKDRKAPRAAGLILEDPVTDCRFKTNSLEKNIDNEVVNLKQLNFFARNYQREPKDVLDPLFSPLLSEDFSKVPSTLIFSSEYSPLTDDAKMLYETLKSAGVPVKLLKIEDRFHGFVKFPGAERWNDEMMSIASFLSGRGVTNIELLTRYEREKIKRTKPRSVVSSDSS